MAYFLCTSGGAGGGELTLSATLRSGETQITFIDGAITTDCSVDVYIDRVSASYKTIEVADGKITLTFSAADKDRTVKLVVNTEQFVEGGKIIVTADDAVVNGKTVTATLGTKTYTETFNNQKATFVVDKFGTYTIQCEDWTVEAEMYSAEIEVLLGIFTLKPTSECTEEDVAKIANAYYNGALSLEDIQSMWHVGDKFTFHVNAMDATGVSESHHEDDYEFVILDFDHDDLTTPINGKTKALLSVQTDRILFTDTTTGSYNYSWNISEECGYINSTNTNAKGWDGCARRTWCNSVFKNSLSMTIQSTMKQVGKNTFASPIIKTSNDYAWLPSEVEIFGTTTHSYAGEGTQYKYFKTESNRYKKPRWNTYNSAQWWERSPYSSSSTHFCCVNLDSIVFSNGADVTLGLAPCFCL